MTSRRGALVVLEGIDGSGTTTQVERLVRALSNRGVPAVATREPTDGSVGRLLRELLTQSSPTGESWQTMALLFAADRVDHQRSVHALLEDGQVVVSDRYLLSSLVYQSLTAPDPQAAAVWVREINVWARRPELTLILEVPAHVAELRRRQRGLPEERFERRALQEKLVSAYAEAERYLPRDRFIHLDGVPGPELVAAAIWAAVQTEPWAQE